MSYQLADGWSSVNFVRPAHAPGCAARRDVVPFPYSVWNSGRETHGHRFEAAVDPVVFANADEYAAKLASDGAVIASFAERRAEIARQLAAAAARRPAASQSTTMRCSTKSPRWSSVRTC